MIDHQYVPSSSKNNPGIFRADLINFAFFFFSFSKRADEWGRTGIQILRNGLLGELSGRVRWRFQDLETDAGLGLCGGDTYGCCALPASSEGQRWRGSSPCKDMVPQCGPRTCIIPRAWGERKRSRMTENTFSFLV